MVEWSHDTVKEGDFCHQVLTRQGLDEIFLWMPNMLKLFLGFLDSRDFSFIFLVSCPVSMGMYYSTTN
jgi:hypothetical protein